MKTRVVASMSIAFIALSLSLVGCTTHEAQPAAASCTPVTAKISWGKGVRTAHDAVLGVHIVTYSENGSMWLDEPKALHPVPSFSATTLDQLTRQSSASSAEWKSALLVGARKTVVGREFARQVPLGKNPVTIDHPVDGVYVVDVGENQMRIPFTVSCTGHSPVRGAVTGALTGGTASFAVRCGVPLTAVQVGEGAALPLSYCPES